MRKTNNTTIKRAESEITKLAAAVNDLKQRRESAQVEKAARVGEYIGKAVAAAIAARLDPGATSMREIDLNAPRTDNDYPAHPDATADPTHDHKIMNVTPNQRTLVIYRERAKGWILDNDERTSEDNVKLSFRRPIEKDATADAAKTVANEYSYLTPSQRQATLGRLSRGEK